ncbi:MAG: hypothetical protein ACK5EU_09060 [Pseudanabaena sp.]|jgi:hypothetical protein|uniref:hypothetical protein n=1 Tax=Pseudanabaena mucicola TaxID=71190 RepID=UPI0025758F17|nr:hypothetical protein [Pseudanabaena mucicola]MCA6573878.1 hypothetical protein [Pseudanabaena sp. M53BS1SP1A06MG]MCA6580635.1 hypothetical protein [Pseudanabaena sp. M34BS1SP1A06MG]MCA6588221.1 hypothetical protein [Pseudanabaena sp. M109S1SP1A06QC]MCA6592639.1 hypothetical protein [Pseudanabaena sp. M38BS1SP1A06MG]MCA6599199.1 hypothetical protein [Pseudanabaena sp. M57BS1SP1A06MG]MCA6602944.1 hypothetical protein [Pseudanabaena sp. M007S1SP1A06QC]MCA6611283.1 hypothetical protein [Pseud
MNDVITEQELLDSLKAYTKSFGVPTFPEEVMAIASSIVTFKQKQLGIPELSPTQVTSLVQQVASQFDIKAIANSITDNATLTLVQGVRQWQQTLEHQVLQTLTAYAQKFQPEQMPDVVNTILAIIPLVENAQLHQLEITSLIQRVSSQFKWEDALAQVVGNDTMAIADQLAKLLQFGDIEELVKQTLIGEHQLLNQPLDQITESLVNSKLAEIIGNNAIHIDLDMQQLMVKQVTFKLNVMASSPAATKSEQEIAQQIDDETTRFRASRQETLNFNNLFNQSQ